MSRIIFIFLLFLAAAIRWPISLLLIIFKNFSNPLKKRINFERKNLFHEEFSRSFKLSYLKADYCFEISSEGELEQVRPLIEYYLKNNKLIEILFSSASVESKCLKLAQDYKNQLKILRLPIASFAPISFLFFQSPWSWVTAPTIIFCRYDFFPELMSFKFLGKKLILLSATCKNPYWYKDNCNSLFDMIVASSDKDEQYFRENLALEKIRSFDFRTPRIFQRLELAGQTMGSVLELPSYLSYLDSKPFFEKLIFGSAWESDLVILKANNEKWTKEILQGTIHLLIVPHELDSDSIDKIKKSLNSFLPKVPVYELSKNLAVDQDLLTKNPGIVIFNISGVLCELYSKFKLAYVGGGYERSIHSVLEPFLSGCQVFCGPKIYRSTEYDYILELLPDEIHLLKNPESFYSLISTHRTKCPEQVIRANLLKNVYVQMESIINEIETC